MHYTKLRVKDDVTLTTICWITLDQLIIRPREQTDKWNKTTVQVSSRYRRIVMWLSRGQGNQVQWLHDACEVGSVVGFGVPALPHDLINRVWTTIGTVHPVTSLNMLHYVVHRLRKRDKGTEEGKKGQEKGWEERVRKWGELNIDKQHWLSSIPLWGKVLDHMSRSPITRFQNSTRQTCWRISKEKNERDAMKYCCRQEQRRKNQRDLWVPRELST